MSLDAIIHWLLTQAARPQDLDVVGAELMNGLCQRLIGAGLALERANLAVLTLHPEIFGFALRYQAGHSTVLAHPRGPAETQESYLKSPLAHIAQTGQRIRRRLVGQGAVRDFPILDTLAEQGMTEYWAVPLLEPAATGSALTLATARPGGFTAEEIGLVEGVLPALSVVVELHERRRLATTLLDTYVGFDAGARILAGQIHRGDGDLVPAALWFNDLRDFTQLSRVLPPRPLLALLNDYFACMADSVHGHGGQVLKFIGDGLLAMFPIVGDDAVTACDQAMAAARDSFTSLADLNHDRADDHPLRVGLALHVGEVLYGNVGTSSRLDFTVTGPAVNEVARVEGLCKQTGKQLLVTEAFARATSAPTELVGEFELRGFATPRRVYALAP